MDNSQLAHIWAQQKKCQGNNSNIFFEHQTIYSYGYHFPLAHFFKKDVVFINSDSYSVSTQRHKSHVYGALSDEITFKVDTILLKKIIRFGLTAKINKEVINQYKESISQLQEEFVRARTHLEFKEELIYMQVLALNSFIGMFTRRKEFTLPESWKEEAANRVETLKAKALKARNAEIQAARIFLEETGGAESTWASQWRRGQLGFSLPAWRNYMQMQRKTIPCMLRLINGVTVRTSQGAEVPANAAMVVIKKMHEVVKELLLNDHTASYGCGYKVGHFTIDRLYLYKGNVFVKAGCHTIPWSEVLILEQALIKEGASHG